MKTLRTLIILLIVALAACGGWLAAGGMNFAADAPHSQLVYAIINFARERSVETRSSGLQAPPLDDAARIAEGAHHYAEMCAGCHLSPGKQPDEFIQGLYPQPPNLTQASQLTPTEAFWIIKHGIKGSAMPAWGLSHDDDKLWAITAFIMQLPSMSAEQYAQLTAEPETESAPAPDAAPDSAPDKESPSSDEAPSDDGHGGAQTL